MIRAVSLCLVLGFLQLPATAQAENEIVRLRAVCAEIKAHLDSFQKVKTTCKEDEREITLEGWLDGQNLRRIVATVPGEHGRGVEEFYLENGRLLFFYSVYDAQQPETGQVIARREERGYFKDGEMFKWLAGEEESVPVDSDEFKAEARQVTKSFKKYKAALLKDRKNS